MKHPFPLRALLSEREMRLSDLARIVGVDKSTATRWARGRVPAERVLAVEKATGVPRHELRPDIYPAPANEAAA